MKYLICLPILMFFACETKPANNIDLFAGLEGYPHVEKVLYDLDNDNIQDTIYLDYAPEFDPGEFTQLNISFSKSGKFHENANDVWNLNDSLFTKSHPNAVQSDRIFVTQQPDATFMLLFGYPYPSGRGEISVLCIANGHPEMQRIEQFTEVIQLADLDGDGITELVGRNNHELLELNHKRESDIGTYAPFYVLSFSKKRGRPFQLNEKLTEKYNVENYVWKGLKYDENIKVAYPLNGGKPKLFVD